ncbi:MAG: DEAD/DEAH box helicase family protein [Candidatus Paceibacterota bacterium]
MLKDISYTEDLSYESYTKNTPFEFYYNCLANSKSLDLRLGYFSSNAIRVLSLGFAQFIHNGGFIRIITNHFLSEEDKFLIEGKYDDINEVYIKSIVNEEVDSLAKILSSGEQHFFDCLSYLLKNKRLIMQPVSLKPNKLAHYKQGIFSDGINCVYFNGSSNFTANGIIENGESIDIRRSWGENFEKSKIDNFKEKFENIIAKSDKRYNYLEPDQVIEVIRKNARDKDEKELLEDSSELITSISNEDFYLQESILKVKRNFKEFIKKELNQPIFPFDEPRAYQLDAKNSWISNGRQGIFAMATGTGKTVTALNCLLDEYKFSENRIYQTLILVPTQTLVDQWESEARSFNFGNIIKVSSKYKWRKKLGSLMSRCKRKPISFIIITTYASFITEYFQKILKSFPDNTLVIADEAHNLGAKSISIAFNNLKLKKRIALSATPKRAYDEEGSTAIEKFFSDSEPYTYSFSMRKAIEKGILCDYYYYPHIVNLQSDEFEDYLELTKKIAKNYFAESDLNKNEYLKKLLNQRKRIVHQARNKISKAEEILTKRYKEVGDLKYSFIYVPEGINMIEGNGLEEHDDEEFKIIDEYISMIDKISEEILVNRIVSGMKNRDEILKQFKKGDIDIVASMKCLDEGVDIPVARFALFCSSTGNPRQFIQRRGRVLRKHGDKISEIHDLVVVGKIDKSDDFTFNTEKRLFEAELKRVLYFSSLALNPKHSFKVFEELSLYYNVNMYKIFNDLDQ